MEAGVATAIEVTGYAPQLSGACPWCSGAYNATHHSGACPRLKRIEYHPDGTIKSVELRPSGASAP